MGNCKRCNSGWKLDTIFNDNSASRNLQWQFDNAAVSIEWVTRFDDVSLLIGVGLSDVPG